jgi:hypothetical protein
MLLVLGHSVFAMYQGRFQESTIIVARRKPEEEVKERSGEKGKGLESPHDQGGKEE